MSANDKWSNKVAQKLTTLAIDEQPDQVCTKLALSGVHASLMHHFGRQVYTHLTQDVCLAAELCLARIHVGAVDRPAQDMAHIDPTDYEQPVSS